MKTAQQLFEEAFGTAEKPLPRSPRSQAYKAGLMNLLRYRLLEIEEFPRPYGEESEAALTAGDAYYAGVGEGWEILRRAGISPDPRAVRDNGASRADRAEEGRDA